METTHIKTQVDAIKPEKRRNIDASRGERCNNCSGLGYLVSIKGASMSCHLCFETGIKAPNIYEMKEQLDNIEKLLKKIANK